MHPRFSYSHKDKNSSMVLLGVIAVVFMFASPASSQTDKAQVDRFKKEAAALQAATDEAINSATPGMGVLQPAKATYLEGYGVVVTVEAALVPNRNPFASPISSADSRKMVAERRTQVRQKLEELIKQRAAALSSVGAEESLAIILYLLNSNPADVPDLPAQMVFTAKKQNPTQVTVREF